MPPFPRPWLPILLLHLSIFIIVWRKPPSACCMARATNDGDAVGSDFTPVLVGLIPMPPAWLLHCPRHLLLLFPVPFPAQAPYLPFGPPVAHGRRKDGGCCVGMGHLFVVGGPVPCFVYCVWWWAVGHGDRPTTKTGKTEKAISPSHDSMTLNDRRCVLHFCAHGATPRPAA